ncbi:MAG TPA: hypothetical protein VGS41_17715, partial [Chthonomonadales bacterium]|nr:hypothetical protein [Chthonomonadales bacterium]
TIMLNYIAADLASYLVTHQLKDPGSMAAQTREMSHGAWLAPLTPGSGLTAGLLLALAAAAWYGFLLRRTAVGYEIRAVGLGQAAARAAGLPVQRTMILSMALAGALAGLAGALEVMGIHHRYVEGVAGTYGFDGIAVALLGGLATAPVILSALFFAALVSGAAYMELQTGVPSSIAVVIQAVVIVAVGVRVLGRPTAIEPAPESALYAAEERHIPDSGGE